MKRHWSDTFLSQMNSELTVVVSGAAAALRRIPLSDFETRRLLLQVQGAGIEAARLTFSTLAPRKT